jgi:hypothetical protein
VSRLHLFMRHCDEYDAAWRWSDVGRANGSPGSRSQSWTGRPTPRQALTLIEPRLPRWCL